MSKSVGIIGLGAMGWGVSRNLMRAGFTVYGCDVNPQSLHAFADAGGIPCANPAEVGNHVGVLLVLVINATQTRTVLFGPEGASKALKPGTAVIASATAAPAFALELAERLGAQGIGLLDCPVSGGVAGAKEGTLTLLTSGSDKVYEQCNDVLAAISAKVYRLGAEPGLASKIKVINQLLVGIHIAAAAEAMALGLRENVDPDLLYEVITHSAGNSWAFQDRIPHILAGDFSPTTALNIFVKDLSLVLDMANDSRFPLPLSSTAYQMFASACCAGYGAEDDTAVIKTFPGIQLPPANSGNFSNESVEETK